MRRTASEKLEIIRLVEGTDLPVNGTLRLGRQYAVLTERDEIKRLTMKRRKKEYLARRRPSQKTETVSPRKPSLVPNDLPTYTRTSERIVRRMLESNPLGRPRVKTGCRRACHQRRER